MHQPKELLQTLKTSRQEDLPFLCLPVGDPIAGRLRPVTTVATDLNRNDVRALTEWRNRYVKSFLTEFEATDERTAQWLTNVVGPDPTRILFMLDDTNNRTIGYLGLAFIDWTAGTGEADAIVRGESGTPGLMTKALLTLLGWAHRELGLTTALNVRVRSDNPQAYRFYLQLAHEMRSVPLREIVEPGMTRWVEDESLVESPVRLVYLTFRDDLYVPKLPIDES